MNSRAQSQNVVSILAKDWTKVSLKKRKAAYKELKGHLKHTPRHIRTRILQKWKNTLLLE